MAHVARKIPTKWYQVGVLLDIETATLDAFAEKTKGQVRLWIMVFDQWKREQNVPYTWETIISILDTLGEKNTATELETWLDEDVSAEITPV